MSVILHSQSKFVKVYNSLMENKSRPGIKSLDCNKSQIQRCFGVNCFKNPQAFKYRIKAFVEDLYQSNQLAWNSQYPGDQTDIVSLNYLLNEKCKNNCELLKVLQSIEYNLYDNEGKISKFNNMLERLQKLIDILKDIIIDSLPEYEQAEWC